MIGDLWTVSDELGAAMEGIESCHQTNAEIPSAVEAGGERVQNHSQQHSEFEHSRATWNSQNQTDRRHYSQT